MSRKIVNLGIPCLAIICLVCVGGGIYFFPEWSIAERSLVVQCVAVVVAMITVFVVGIQNYRGSRDREFERKLQGVRISVDRLRLRIDGNKVYSRSLRYDSELYDIDVPRRQEDLYESRTKGRGTVYGEKRKVLYLDGLDVVNFWVDRILDIIAIERDGIRKEIPQRGNLLDNAKDRFGKDGDKVFSDFGHCFLGFRSLMKWVNKRTFMKTRYRYAQKVIESLSREEMSLILIYGVIGYPNEEIAKEIKGFLEKYGMLFILNDEIHPLKENYQELKVTLGQYSRWAFVDGGWDKDKVEQMSVLIRWLY